METLAASLESPTFARFVNVHGWIWPSCEIVHFFGMALLIGTVGALDLRLLGVAKGLPVREVHRLVPWGVVGFILTLVTGSVFVLGDAVTPVISRFHNLAFQLKMLFMGLAGINILAFYVTGVSHAANAVGPWEDAGIAAKVIAIASLFFWICVIYFGRMIMYQDDLYVHQFFASY